ncbi:MAG: HEPN domain-containing protein [Ignavibacterium sp.]
MDDASLNLSQYRLEKAEIELSISKILFEKGFYAKSMNSSYYAMFHSVLALLALDKVDSKKHSGVLNYFNNIYIRTNKISSEYFKYISSAFNIRLQSDYNDFFIASRKEAEDQISNAEKFLIMIKEYLSNQTRNF